MKRIRAFCEFPAGLAALSLRLHGGPHCRPPITRRGSKVGYAEVILAILGRRSGESAERFVFADADPDVQALLRAYPDGTALRAIADTFRGWSGEDPRMLWERLTAERLANGPPLDVAGLAGWMWASSHSYRKGDISSGWQGSDATKEEGCRNLTHTLADQAEFIAGAATWPETNVLIAIPCAADLAVMLGTPGSLDDVIIYSDPDYRNTTGYADTCREAIPALAREWSAMGAVVAISEQEPIPELADWFSTEITEGRRGNTRTFSAQRAEFVTMNREPNHRVASQPGLFG